VSSAIPPSTRTDRSGIAQAAGIIAAGNIASRVLGLVREQLIAYLFGASGLVSAFGVAAIVPKMIYELLIGGMLSAALVPVFSQVEELEGRSALWSLFNRVVSLAAMVLAVIVLLLEVLAPQVAWLLGGGFAPELQVALAQMIRIIAPAVLFLGLSGVVTGFLYTLKRFTYPAFGAAVFNLGIITAALLLAGRMGVFSLALGVVLGATAQLLIQTPELRRVRLRFRFRLNLSDPALQQILKLYLPIAVGLIISNVQIAIDRRLASSTGASSIAWMDRATTLIQLPHGLVAVAISLAALPTLSRFSAAQDWNGFRQTLGAGVRAVLILIVPATCGLLVLAQPTVALLFEHGKFTAYDTYWTAWALRYYLIGLIFAAVDWPLNYAFYARQDTLTPALVGILSVGVYLAVALPLIGPLGMLGLVLADSAKHVSHAGTMLYLTRQRLGSLADMQLGKTLLKVLLASGAMTAAMVATRLGLVRLQVLGGSLAALLTVGAAGGVGLFVYLSLMTLFRVDEIGVIRGRVGERLRRPHLD
jgi:putative peptidoglycan lipid II flippase